MSLSLSDKTVGILGGGQLGRMLVEAGNRLNLNMIVLDAENCPAAQISAPISHSHIVGSFTKKIDVERLAEKCDIITTEIEHVDTTSLETLRTTTIEPSWQTIRTIQDKFAQKEHLKQHGIPMAEHVELVRRTDGELEAAGKLLGYPFMLKSKTGAYDGKGNFVVRNDSDIPDALNTLRDRPLFAEKWAKYRMEVAVIVVKTKEGVLSYPMVETIQENSICSLVYAPARNVTKAVNEKAQALAKRVVAAFEGKGVYGVEMFLMEDDSLLLCEVACRVHNSGHYTIEGCPMSQFEAHLRAILDLPISAEDLEIEKPSIMLNIIGGEAPDAHMVLARKSSQTPCARLHLYGKGAGRKGRKMGHVTVTGRTMSQAESRIQALVDTAHHVQSSSPAIKPATKPTAEVAVIMGSDSDLPKLVAGLKILEDFEIPFAVEITSAHRTPDYMFSYVSNARARGIKCIIAAAGGAAHLPGMAAAKTTLPVIGIPIAATHLDGVDSVHSILQMPRGVPVATVAINNSVNAALLAARIVGVEDARVEALVERYAEGARLENMEKGKRLGEVGWREYVAGL